MDVEAIKASIDEMEQEEVVLFRSHVGERGVSVWPFRLPTPNKVMKALRTAVEALGLVEATAERLSLDRESHSRRGNALRNLGLECRNALATIGETLGLKKETDRRRAVGDSVNAIFDAADALDTENPDGK